MKLNTVFLTFLIYLISLISCSFQKQIIDYNQEGAITSDNTVISLKKNKIFNDNIKTVLCHKKHKKILYQ